MSSENINLSFPRSGVAMQLGTLRRPVPLERYAGITLVPKLLLGNPVSKAPALRAGKLELPVLNSQAGAWELAERYTVIPAGMPESSHRDVNLSIVTVLRLSSDKAIKLPSMALDPATAPCVALPPASMQSTGIHAGMTTETHLCITMQLGTLLRPYRWSGTVDAAASR